MAFDPTNPNEVTTAILTMKNNSSIHDIPTKFMRLFLPCISVALSDLFNSCISKCKYPSKLKISKITPVFKKGSPNLIANHRPISILPNISKIFEQLINTRLKSFFEPSGSLSENQFGFRRDKNTELAIMNLIHRALPAIENKQYALCIFLDFSACFDTISRELLIQKLQKYGVRVEAMD